MHKRRPASFALISTVVGILAACGSSSEAPPAAAGSAGGSGRAGSFGSGGNAGASPDGGMGGTTSNGGSGGSEMDASGGTGGSLTESGTDVGTRQAALDQIVFEERFTATADAVEDSAVGQCGSNPGLLTANFNTWTPNIRIDTDDRPGGCQQSFAIRDPTGALMGATLKVTFEPDGEPAQCGQPGDHLVPITSGGTDFSSFYTIDTDNRSGGCTDTFSLEGVNDVVLDVDFEPDPDAADAGASQCGNPGIHTVSAGLPVTIRLNTDTLPGGCYERFRLRTK